jgi:hypothetical protein
LLSNESVASSVSELDRQYLERRLSEERTAIKWISTAIFPLNLSTVTVPKPEIGFHALCVAAGNRVEAEPQFTTTFHGVMSRNRRGQLSTAKAET